MNKKEKTLIILGIIFIAFNLRAPITAVGSVVEMIKSEYHLTSGMTGFITTLPLLAFALISPFVAKISQKLGYGKTMFLGLVFILVGEFTRSYTNVLGLFLGTTFLGIGIAIGNVLIPSIIKLKFKGKVGMMTSVYTSCMCIFAAVGAGISVPLAKGLDLGWKHSLSSWFVLTIITLFIWLPQLKSSMVNNIKSTDNIEIKSKSIWKSATAWWVTLFMGIQSLLFYSLVAWLPTIIIFKGMTDAFAGTMALTFQLTAIPATLIIPVLCDRYKHQRGLVVATCMLYLSGMGLFLFGQSHILITIAVLLMSLGMGGSISLAIAFISLRSPNASKASELSGMSQSAGYLLAAIGPIMMGIIYDFLQDWSIPIMIFIGMIILLTYCGWHAGSDIVTQE